MYLNKMIGRGIGALLLLLVVAACGGGADSGGAAITVNDPWVRPAVMTGMSDTDDTGEMSGDMDGEMSGDMDGEMSGDMDGEMSGDMDGEMSGDMSGMHSGGGNSAAYMTLVNNGNADAAVVSASTDAAETVELHISEMNEQGVMSMRPVEQIVIPANGQAVLQPGGLHVMLIGLTRDLTEGATVDLTLTLESGDELAITAPVGQSAP
jgi:hypothetical protein